MSARDCRVGVQIEGVERGHSVSVDGESQSLPYEMTKTAAEFTFELSNDGRDAAVIQSIALSP
jgi:hypothetical protein